MGLDLVEMVYRLEEEFEIIIPNEIAETLITPGNVIDYLMSLSAVNQKWSRDYVHTLVWQIIVEESGIRREKFNDDSRFVEDMGLD